MEKIFQTVRLMKKKARGKTYYYIKLPEDVAFDYYYIDLQKFRDKFEIIIKMFSRLDNVKNWTFKRIRNRRFISIPPELVKTLKLDTKQRLQVEIVSANKIVIRGAIRNDVNE